MASLCHPALVAQAINVMTTETVTVEKDESIEMAIVMELACENNENENVVMRGNGTTPPPDVPDISTSFLTVVTNTVETAICVEMSQPHNLTSGSQEISNDHRTKKIEQGSGGAKLHVQDEPAQHHNNEEPRDNIFPRLEHLLSIEDAAALRSLTCSNGESVELALQSLSKHATEYIPVEVFGHLLSDSSCTIRNLATLRLKDCGTAGPRRACLIVTLLQHQNVAVREATLDALWGMKGPTLDAVPSSLLVDLLRDSSYLVRDLAVDCLKSQDRVTVSAVAGDLMKLLYHHDTAVREGALAVIEHIEKDIFATISVEMLVDLLQDTSYSVQAWAAKCIKDKEIKELEPHASKVVLLLHHPYSEVRETAVDVLRPLGSLHCAIPADVVAHALMDSCSLKVRLWAECYIQTKQVG